MRSTTLKEAVARYAVEQRAKLSDWPWITTIAAAPVRYRAVDVSVACSAALATSSLDTHETSSSTSPGASST